MAAEPAVVLEEWRRAERLLRLLPPTAPEADEVAAHIEQMRVLYQSLTRNVEVTHAKLAASQRRIHATTALLDRIADHYGLDRRAAAASDGDGPPR